jgi:hypothetical protein
MRSGLVVRASDCQCRSRNSPGFGGPSILRHRGIQGAADEVVLITVEKNKKIPLLRKKKYLGPGIIEWRAAVVQHYLYRGSTYDDRRNATATEAKGSRTGPDRRPAKRLAEGEGWRPLICTLV